MAMLEKIKKNIYIVVVLIGMGVAHGELNFTRINIKLSGNA